MAQRRGWDNLSDNYRKRLIRNGIDRTAYDAGVSLKKARGKQTPIPGIGEKRYASLLRLAQQGTWPGKVTPRDVVDDELRRGTDPTFLKQALTNKLDSEKDYRQWLTDHGFRGWFDAKKAGAVYDGPGHARWLTRRLSVGVELYWYH